MTGRLVAVLTTGRQDWGILHSTCAALRDRARLRLAVLAGGMHLEERHGLTIREVREDGFEPEELAWAADPAPERQAAGALVAVAEALDRRAPDMLLLVGDRYEVAAAALAATLRRVPIAHLHGGERTGGAFDEQLRHAITKLSHLHLVSSEESGRRVAAMGEDPATIHVVGAPGTDAIRRADLPDRAELERELGLPLESPLVLVTVHPATLAADPSADVDAVLGAMAVVDATWVVTLPNADPGNEEIRERLLRGAGSLRRAVAVEALGHRRYWGLMRIADAMLGNSSSALVEAPAARLPAVDVGVRQEGRQREANVVHAEAASDAVASALRRVLRPAFRRELPEPGESADGAAGLRVATILERWQPPRPPVKAPIEVEP